MSLSSDDIRDNFESSKRGTKPKKKMAYCKTCKKFVDRNNHEHFSNNSLVSAHKDPDNFIPFTPEDSKHWVVKRCWPSFRAKVGQ